MPQVKQDTRFKGQVFHWLWSRTVCSVLYMIYCHWASLEHGPTFANNQESFIEWLKTNYPNSLGTPLPHGPHSISSVFTCILVIYMHAHTAYFVGRPSVVCFRVICCTICFPSVLESYAVLYVSHLLSVLGLYAVPYVSHQSSVLGL